MIKIHVSKSAIAWVAGVLLTLILIFLFGKYPELAENVYYRGIYKIYRHLWDLVFSWNPIPIFYIWVLFLLLFMICILTKVFIDKGNRIRYLKWFFAFLAAHFIWFYWSWGFNYSRITLGQRWQINTPINDEVFIKEFYAQTKLIDSLRTEFKTEIDHYEIKPVELENKVRKLVIDFHRENGFMTFEKIRCRNLSLQGILLVWSTSGVYMPFAGESQLDGGLHRLSKPFTMAHELCHGMGWTHEGDCNFMAYLICKSSDDVFVRYSAELGYWRYLFANASRVHPEHFKQVRSSLNPDVLNDLIEINAANNRYPEIFPALREWFYDWFLKKQGIASGDKSYAEIIRMVVNYELSQRDIIRKN